MSKRFKDFFFGEPTLPSRFYDQLPEEYRRLAFTVGQLNKVESIKKVMEDMAQGLEKYQSFDEWRATLDDAFYEQFADGYLKTVYRTNLSTAYTNGIIEQAESTGFTTKYAFQAILDSETRENHAACDGIVLPTDDNFWVNHTPPLGYNCRCTLIPLNEENEVDSTPRSDISLKETAPDQGFGKKGTPSLDQSLTNQFRKSVNEIPNSDLRTAAASSFATKSAVVKDFVKENQKNFTKPKK